VFEEEEKSMRGMKLKSDSKFQAKGGK